MRLYTDATGQCSACRKCSIRLLSRQSESARRRPACGRRGGVNAPRRARVLLSRVARAHL